jgi:RING-like zinc finger
VLGGGEDDSEHPIPAAAAAACRKDINDGDDDAVFAILVNDDGEAGAEEARRSLDVEVGGGGTAAASGLDNEEEQERRDDRATLGSESADLSTSFGDGTSSSRAWIRVPSAGHPQEASEKDRCRQRLVPSQCAICLSSMARGENVTWSSNPNCQHVFHYRCVPQIGSVDAVSRASTAQQPTRAASSSLRCLNVSTHTICWYQSKFRVQLHPRVARGKLEEGARAALSAAAAPPARPSAFDPGGGGACGGHPPRVRARSVGSGGGGNAGRQGRRWHSSPVPVLPAGIRFADRMKIGREVGGDQAVRCRGKDCLVRFKARLVPAGSRGNSVRVLHRVCCTVEVRGRDSSSSLLRRRRSPILESTTERPDILDQVSTSYSEAGYSNTNCFRRVRSLGDVRVLLRSDPDSRTHLMTRTFTGNRSIEVHAYCTSTMLIRKRRSCFAAKNKGSRNAGGE